MSDATEEKPAKKPGKMKKMLMLGVAIAVIGGGGAGAGLYAANSGLLGGGGAEAKTTVDPNRPQLVLKGQGKPAASGEGEEKAGEGGDGEAAAPRSGPSAGGEKYESTYYQIEREFTSNLKESPRFVQVGIGVVTNYDDRVIENLKRHEMPVRSAVLLTLADEDENAVFTAAGKEDLSKRLTIAINKVLTKKEGFGGIADVYFTNFIIQ